MVLGGDASANRCNPEKTRREDGCVVRRQVGDGCNPGRLMKALYVVLVARAE